MSKRVEHDSIGELPLPADSLYGIHTARALTNFPITGVRLSHFPELPRALAMVKKAAALANAQVGALAPELAEIIAAVCDEIIDGKHHEHFVVDMIQGGAGTSTNMNANEVIANLGLDRLGRPRGDYRHLHPNDHVNCSQSTNDVYPTAARLAILLASRALMGVQRHLSEAFAERGRAFAGIVKVGRTQLMDAVPMTLGMEFSAFAATINEDIERLGQVSDLLRETNLGGTAVGTGINAPAGYREAAVSQLSAIFGMPLIPATDLVEASSDLGAFVTFSGVLKRIAVKLSKICNDLRLLGSGPRAGIGEIILPAVQAGSSIMPGKVNPVIPEVVNQTAYQVIGNDLTVTLAAEAGQLQLNVMEPVVIFNILQSIRMLEAAMTVLTERCVTGIVADETRIASLLSNSLVAVTALVPRIGYENAVAVAKAAQGSGHSVEATVVALGFLTHEEFAALMQLEPLTESAARADNKRKEEKS
ncbi:aspartate ammonia-lyase [Devosia sp. 1635]|uniref:aspartate ammonia-lyase n=1 Tax=Devosia sp. 1635 TaxID=2726066 RepID=UPI001566B694|nr:aspartate ammonia-lyase [Devosia sp. 1635]